VPAPDALHQPRQATCGHPGATRTKRSSNASPIRRINILNKRTPLEQPPLNRSSSFRDGVIARGMLKDSLHAL